MTSTSTELCHCQLALRGRMWGAVRVHFFLGGSHLSLQELLKTRNSLQCLACEVQHVLGAQEAVGRMSGGGGADPEGLGGVVENYSTDKTSVPSGVEGPAAVHQGRLGWGAAAAAGEKGASSWGRRLSNMAARGRDDWLPGERAASLVRQAWACNSSVEGRDGCVQDAAQRHRVRGSVGAAHKGSQMQQSKA
jgi:hypothetical protein